MRLDKYLKVSRIIKRRTVANEACSGGRVTLNGKVAKPGAEVKPGDIMTIRFGDHLGRYEILGRAGYGAQGGCGGNLPCAGRGCGDGVRTRRGGINHVGRNYFGRRQRAAHGREVQ